MYLKRIIQIIQKETYHTAKSIVSRSGVSYAWTQNSHIYLKQKTIPQFKQVEIGPIFMKAVNIFSLMYDAAMLKVVVIKPVTKPFLDLNEALAFMCQTLLPEVCLLYQQKKKKQTKTEVYNTNNLSTRSKPPLPAKGSRS